VGVTFSLWVPRSYNVDIKTRRGSIDIGKLNGSFNAYTSDGKITFECDPEAVDIEVEDKTAGDDEPETSPVDYNTGNEPDSRHGRV
jgi:hypothetical protein